jgi:hypothetical protein
VRLAVTDVADLVLNERAIVAVCERATAHNYGQTVIAFGSSFIGDRVTVTMSSWPRAREAERELAAMGYVVDIDADNTLVVRLGVVSS